jgi:hypothetical protein
MRPLGVVVAACAEEVANETLDSFVVGLAALGAKLPHALSGCSLPMGKFTEYLPDGVHSF